MKKHTLAVIFASLALSLGGCLIGDSAEQVLTDDCVSLCEDAGDRGCSGVELDCEAVCDRQEEIDCAAEYVDMMECLDDAFQRCDVEITVCEPEKNAYKTCLAPHLSQPGG